MMANSCAGKFKGQALGQVEPSDISWLQDNRAKLGSFPQLQQVLQVSQIANTLPLQSLSLARTNQAGATPQPGPAAEPPALPSSASPNVTTGRRPQQHRSSCPSYAYLNLQQRQHNDGQFERLLHEYQLENVDFFANGRMFALGAFLDVLGDGTKKTFERGLVDVGRQLNDNA